MAFSLSMVLQNLGETSEVLVRFVARDSARDAPDVGVRWQGNAEAGYPNHRRVGGPLRRCKELRL